MTAMPQEGDHQHPHPPPPPPTVTEEVTPVQSGMDLLADIQADWLANENARLLAALGPQDPEQFVPYLMGRIAVLNKLLARAEAETWLARKEFAEFRSRHQGEECFALPDDAPMPEPSANGEVPKP